MLLAGIILTIAFVTTALTLSQVTALEREAASDPSPEIAGEWRFIRDRLATNLEISVTPEMTASTLTATTIPGVASTFRTVAAEKGYDFVLRLASDPAYYPKSERDLLDPPGSGPNYNALPVKGARLTHVRDASQTDGILWSAAGQCADTSVSTCIQAVLVYVKMSDGTSSMEETLLYRVNTP